MAAYLVALATETNFAASEANFAWSARPVYEDSEQAAAEFFMRRWDRDNPTIAANDVGPITTQVYVRLASDATLTTTIWDVVGERVSRFDATLVP